MAATSQAVPVPGLFGTRSVYLSQLLGRPVADLGGQPLGRLADVIVRLRGAQYPLVTGLVIRVGRREVFVPARQVRDLTPGAVKVASATLDLRRFERREGEVLLRADVLGYRLIEVSRARLIRARDLRLTAVGGEWVLDAVDTGFRPRRLLRLVGGHGRSHEPRDWREFEPLIGHVRTAPWRGRFTRVHRLRPAQIADLLEEASQDEGTEILGRVHADPELEADVFEELDEELASRLLGARADAEIASVLARMGADDAADVIMELPQRRRQPVLDLLPAGQRIRVKTLMGFNPSSAGGLMGSDFLAVPGSVTIGDALEAVRRSRTLPPAALSSVHAVDDAGRLLGTAHVVALLQSCEASPLADACDRNPVRIGPGTDVTDVAVLMTDYNLTTIPVVDPEDRMLGLITVDDVLEVTVPENWRRREAAVPPDPHQAASQAADASGEQP
jgi:CBS domain-containing protein/sporulation protein YlmC with PRC-barrel domain